MTPVQDEPVRLAGAQIIEAPAKTARRESGILFDTLTLSVIAGLAKVAGAAKSVAIASVFGSGAALDNYLLAFLIPSVLADTFCGALVPVTVPRLIELEHRSGEEASRALYARLLTRSLLFSMIGAAALALVIGAMLEFGGSRTPMNWRPIGMLALIMLPVIPCNAVSNVWRAVLNSQNRFVAPAITAILTPAVMIAIVLAAGSRGGVWTLAIATTLGSAGEVAVLAGAIRRSGFPIMPQAHRSVDLTRNGFSIGAFRKEYGYLVASGLVSGGTVAIGQMMAAWLGAGSVSALNYGTRLSTVLMSIGPAALGVAVLPRFSLMAAHGDWHALKHSLRRLLWITASASAAAAALFILFSTSIVRLTLQHGAFTSADTGTVAAVQQWSLVQMPFVVGISIFMRLFSALKANRVLLPLSAGSLAVNLALNYLLMHRYGVAGISLASSIAQALLFTAMGLLVFGPGGRRLTQEGR